MDRSRRPFLAAGAAALLAALPLAAQQPGGAASGGGADLAKQLANPISSLVSVPFQANWDFGAGEEDPRSVINIQPVMPFRLTRGWSFIFRLITPLVSQPPVVDGDETHFGVGDLTIETFLTPAKPGFIIWGIGPALALPMSTDPALGSGKWSAGPTGIALHQGGHWTVGALVTQLWSYAGDDDRDDVSQTLLQPFLAYAAPKQVTITLNSETAADWMAEDGQEWTAPVHLQVSKVAKLGRQPISLLLGGGYFVEKPDGGPDWRLRAAITLLIPEK